MSEEAAATVETPEPKGKNYGEPEKEMPDIINANRKCRDIFCLLLFIIAWVAWLILAIMAFTDGCPDQCNDPRKLIYGYDSSGCRCGSDCTNDGGPDNRNKLRLYIPDPRDLSVRLCLASCPSSFTSSKNDSATIGAYLCPSGVCNTCPQTTSKSEKCFYNERALGKRNDVISQTDSCFLPTSNTSDCWYQTYPTSDIFYKCVPSILTSTNVSDIKSFPLDVSFLGNTTSVLTNPAGEIGQMTAELAQMWSLLLIALALAVCFGFIYLILVRLFAKCMMFITVFGLLIVMILCTLFMWDKSGKIEVFATVSKTTGLNISTLASASDVMKTPGDTSTAYAFAIILTIATCVYVVILCIMLRRLIIAITVIQEAAKSMAAIPTLLLLPLTTFLALVLLYVWAGFIAIYLLSAGEFDPKTGKFVYSGGTCSRDMQSVNINVTQPTAIVRLTIPPTYTLPTITIADSALLLSLTPTSAAFPVGACMGYLGGMAGGCAASVPLKSRYLAGADRVSNLGTVAWDAQAGTLGLTLPRSQAAWPASLNFSVNLYWARGAVAASGWLANGTWWEVRSANVTSNLRGMSSLEASRWCNLYGGTAKATTALAQQRKDALAGDRLSDVNELPSSSFLAGVTTWRSALPVTLDGTTYNYFVIYHLFMFLWTNTFLCSSGFYVTCGAVAAWYWADDKRNLGPSPLLKSAWRYARYNVGTVAFGSFLIAVVQLIRILFNYYVKQCERFKNNPAVKAMVCMVNCCLWCLEKFIGFINRNAYIVSATHGHGFCTSAWKGFALVLRNLLRVAAVHAITPAVLLVGRLFVFFATLALSYIIGQAMVKSMGLVNGVPILTLIFIGLMAWFVAGAFLAVFEAAVDTVLLSFLYDSVRHGGSI
mmetsp:Transcript_2338/g.6220  ORF Transcript_2338/g.6220 Transcript_2338/m.6220 type:complete len:881 (+) Transcript_2338:94-2736(+)|eukprot:CAMPEP_0113671194 /NCGR_PEP_ID=MMETSP0038_2-20120614/5570_1 /TAXON_ID=2898 /ORGANISM="Cryptomonas paramecium" /LENGTH=880 /DNA_ID=CAMNT_0000587321 /DNA_START=94 /DNA_END=2736 /DNA_ORIENTATION=+ /assembly_acc=CAM_ASM_000170